MSIWLDMRMQALSADLKKRLAVLTEEDPAAYARQLVGAVSQIRESKEFQAARRRYAALADERRLLALSLLKREGELCACELQTALELSHATISHHMDELREAGLIDAERRGKWTYYSLTATTKALVP